MRATKEAIRELAEGVLAGWRAEAFDERVFAEVAERALSQAELARRIAIPEFLDWLHTDPDLPSSLSGENEFGQPTITVYRSERFRIEVIFWTGDGRTLVHSHVSPGAFYVLSGARLQNEYSFSQSERIDDTIAVGRLARERTIFLLPGDIRRIGVGDAFIHDLLFLDPLCMTVSVRSAASDPDAAAQYSSPSLRVGRNLLAQRRQIALATLDRTDPTSFRAVAERMLGAAPATAYLGLSSLFSVVGRDEFEGALARARKAQGSWIDAVGPALVEARRREEITAAYGRLQRFEDRLPIGLLWSGATTSETHAALAAAFPAEEPEALLARCSPELRALVADDRPPEQEIYATVKRALAFPDGPVLRAFEKLLERPKRNFELSAQIDGDVVHETRMAAIFHRDPDCVSSLESIRSLLGELKSIPDVRLDLSLVARLFRGLDLNRVTLCGCGVDLRARAPESRVKVWVVVVEHPEKVNDILEAHGYDDDILCLMPGNVLLAGVDLSLDGRTRMKIYPKYRSDELANIAVQSRLRRVLSAEALAWMMRGKRANVSFEADRERTLHIQPKDPDAFVRELGSAKIDELVANRAELGMKLNVVSLRERDLIARSFDKANLYWVPASDADNV